MSIEDRATELKDTFDFLDDWEARYAHVIDLGKALPPLDSALMVDTFKVPGCASQVWIIPKDEGDAKVRFLAGSDAMIVSGLIALLVELFDDADPQAVLDFDAPAFFADIGLNEALSAQRANGLRSMLERIHHLAQARLSA